MTITPEISKAITTTTSAASAFLRQLDSIRRESHVYVAEYIRREKAALEHALQVMELASLDGEFEPTLSEPSHYTTKIEDFQLNEAGGYYYCGPLELAKRAARESNNVAEHSSTNGRWSVFLSVEDLEPLPSNSDYDGTGGTREEAWRWALGAAYGPLNGKFEAVTF